MQGGVDMERFIDRLMHREVTIKSVRITVLDIIFLTVFAGLALAGRIALYPYMSGDYVSSLLPWMEQIRYLGGLPSLGYEISNYSSAYMIIMSLLSYMQADPLYLLKTVSVIFDYLAAAAVFMIVHHLTAHSGKAIRAACGMMLVPTVILNGAFWGQCDMIYIAFLLWGLYFLCRGNSRRALRLTAVGFAFKLQALFIIPFYLIMWLCPLCTVKGKDPTVRLRDFLILPLPYLILTVPGIILGRDLWSSIGVYFGQTQAYPWLTLNYPNIYAFFGQTFLSEYQVAELGKSGIMMTILVLGMLAYYLYARRTRMDGNMMITTAILSIGLVVYGLPYMHERYGLLIDVLAVIYASLRPRKLPIAMGLIVSSLISYMMFLFGREGLPPLYHAALQLGLLIAVGMDLAAQVHAPQNAIPDCPNEN